MSFFKKYKQKTNTSQQVKSDDRQIQLSSDIKQNITEIQTILSNTPDLVIRNLVIKQNETQAAVIYLSGITDTKTIYNHIISPLLFKNGPENSDSKSLVALGSIKQVTTWSEIEIALLSGECILLVDNITEAFIYDTPDFPKRSIEDTPIESSLTGPHVGFTEAASQNIALIRKQIQNRELKIKEMIVGERSRTKVAVMYLADVANPDLLQEIDRRIQGLEADTVLTTGVLAEYIEDNPYSPFPQLLITERPDFAAAEILEGRYVIVVDRSPSVIVAPITFDSFFKTTDDYGSRWMVGSFIRLIRYFGFFISIFLPSIYIAIISFHFEIIPLKLLLSIGVSRERIPFPPYIEAFIMELTLEMLREAGVRLPAKIGQTVGIVGGIVIGQAAVEAGVVSNIMVIVVALTAIASFIIPNYDMSTAIRLVRFPMMILASFFGFVGITVGLMILIAHFITLQSLGTPYGTPIAPLRYYDWKDVFIRFPVWAVKERPSDTEAIQMKKSKSNRPEGEN